MIVSGKFMDGSTGTFTQRINLSKTGIVYTTLLCEKATGKLMVKPTVSFYGMLFRDDINPDFCRDECEEFLEDFFPEIARRADWDEALRVELRRFFKKRCSHKPVVIPVLLEI